MKHVLLVDPDRIAAQCMKHELEKIDIQCSVAHTATTAIQVADQKDFDAVIVELSLPGHSGSEFLYEFRTYTDWQAVPVVVYSTIKVPEIIQQSKDWKMLAVNATLYRSDHSLQDVVQLINELTR